MSRVNIDLNASICCPHLSAGPLIKVGSICVTFWALFLFFFLKKEIVPSFVRQKQQVTAPMPSRLSPHKHRSS